MLILLLCAAAPYDAATFETLRWGAQAPYPPFTASSSLAPDVGPEKVADDSPFTATGASAS